MLPAPRVQAIDYQPDSTVLFRAVAHLPHPIWLDSDGPASPYGRYDIIPPAPDQRPITPGRETRIENEHGPVEVSGDNPFHLLQAHLPAPLAPVPDLPFVSGALGFFGYDLRRRPEQLPSLARQDIQLPDMCVGIYSWALIQDHQKQQAWLVSQPEATLDAITTLVHPDHLTLLPASDNNPLEIKVFRPELNVAEYASHITKIQNYIRTGDCYQVN